MILPLKISFSYDKAETLRDISLHIKKNKTTEGWAHWIR